MRRVIRPPLAEVVQENLIQRQAEADRKRMEDALRVNDEWQTARQSRPLLAVLATLKQMMGERERCMYCLDSHGTDIEHFWPKTPYPERMFLWPNLLLCCAECGRLKGNRFPLVAGQPMLVDPTAEEPWPTAFDQNKLICPRSGARYPIVNATITATASFQSTPCPATRLAVYFPCREHRPCLKAR
jgi:5-methylcytosine-specific restriction endonuclease McrA